MGRFAALVVALAVVALFAGCDPSATVAVSDGDDPGRETWQCFERRGRSRRAPLVTLRRSTGVFIDWSAEVAVAGAKHPAVFKMEGLNRRWNFGLTMNLDLPYAVIIKPDGTGLYYDFTPSTDGRAEASDFFDCRLAR